MVEQSEFGPVTAGGITLAARRLGRGPRMVFLHGGPGLDHHLLLPLARRLADAWEVWLPDLPGHGASGAPLGRLPGLTRLVDQTGRWLAGLPGGMEVLVGHSLGAWLAREVLRRGPVSPRAAVLLTPPAAEQTEASPTVSALRRGLSRAGEPDRREARRSLEEHVRQETGDKMPDELRRAVEHCRVRPPWAYRALLRNLLRRYRAPVRPFEPPCPVLVVGAERDRTTPPVHAARVARSMEGAELEIVAGMGHYLERVDDVAREIRDFVIRTRRDHE